MAWKKGYIIWVCFSLILAPAFENQSQIHMSNCYPEGITDGLFSERRWNSGFFSHNTTFILKHLIQLLHFIAFVFWGKNQQWVLYLPFLGDI